MQSDGSNVNLQRTDPRIAERGGGMRGMFSLAALRWCGGDSANTSQSRRPRSRNGIAHPESEKVKFIFLYICIFFLPFLSLALPYPERIETTKTGLFFFFSMVMYNSRLLIKKILPEVIHLSSLSFFF